MTMKLAFIDVETTGVDHKIHAMIQLAMIIEIDGQVVSENEWKIRPHEGLKIDQGALDIHGMSLEEIGAFPLPSEVHRKMVTAIHPHVDKYNKQDKLWFLGYNAGFDYQFCRAFFGHCGDKYFGSFFHYPPIDVMGHLAMKYSERWARLKDRKLKTVVEEYLPEIAGEIDFHDAMADIQATRELWRLCI